MTISERLLRRAIRTLLLNRQQSRLLAIIWDIAAEVFYEDNPATRELWLCDLISDNALKEIHAHALRSRVQ